MSNDVDYWKEKLFKALGDNKPAYVRTLRSWFKKECSKEDFDLYVNFLLPPADRLLHNR